MPTKSNEREEDHDASSRKRQKLHKSTSVQQPSASSPTQRDYLITVEPNREVRKEEQNVFGGGFLLKSSGKDMKYIAEALESEENKRYMQSLDIDESFRTFILSWEKKVIEALENNTWHYLPPVPEHIVDKMIELLSDVVPYHTYHHNKGNRVEGYFGTQLLKPFFSALDASLIQNTPSRLRYAYSSVVTAFPTTGGGDGSWHTDDGDCSNPLTLIIGILLSNVSDDEGPTQMAFPEGLPQSDTVKIANMGDDSPKVTGKKGTAFVYTSRVEHRGLKNSSKKNRKQLFVVFEPFNYSCKNMQIRQKDSFIVHGGLSDYNTYLLDYEPGSEDRQRIEKHVKNLTAIKLDTLSRYIPCDMRNGDPDQLYDADGYVRLDGPYQFWR